MRLWGGEALITSWLGHDDDYHYVDGNGVGGGGLADGDDDDEVGTRSVGRVCACLHCLLIFLALPTLPTNLTASRSRAQPRQRRRRRYSANGAVCLQHSSITWTSTSSATRCPLLALHLSCLSWRNNVGEGDLLFVAKEPNFTDPRNLHLQRTNALTVLMLILIMICHIQHTNALTVPASLTPTDADMSHSNCDDSKFPESKGKDVLVKSNFYVKTFVERSNHHSEKPIFSFLINQRRLNTRSNRPKELKLNKEATKNRRRRQKPRK